MEIPAYRIDENGFYVGVVILQNERELQEALEDKTLVFDAPPDSLFRSKRENGEWTEGLSEEEIAERMKPQPVPPDLIVERIEGIEALNLDTIEQVVTLYEENLQIKAENAQLKQELIEEKEAHLNTMDAVVQLYEQVLSIEERMNV
jgi:hypothetical protein